MNEPRDYLFDKAGEPDREIAALEALFGEFAHDGRPLPASAIPATRRGPARRLRVLPYVVAAALVAALVLLWSRDGESDAEVVLARGDAARVVTADTAPRRVVAAGLFELTLQPGGRLRVDGFDDEAVRLHLVRGELEARIDSPVSKGVPAVRLDCDVARFEAGWQGPCALRLSVGEDGAGTLRVVDGEANGDSGGRRLVVPAGAAVSLAKDGPGWPMFDDCTPELREVAERMRFRSEKMGPDVSAKAAYGLVTSVRTPRDTLVLWHALQLGDSASEARIEMRLLELAGVPGKQPAKSWSSDAWLDHLRASAWRPSK